MSKNATYRILDVGTMAVQTQHSYNQGKVLYRNYIKAIDRKLIILGLLCSIKTVYWRISREFIFKVQFIIFNTIYFIIDDI